MSEEFSESLDSFCKENPEIMFIEYRYSVINSLVVYDVRKALLFVLPFAEERINSSIYKHAPVKDVYLNIIQEIRRIIGMNNIGGKDFCHLFLLIFRIQQPRVGLGMDIASVLRFFIRPENIKKLKAA